MRWTTLGTVFGVGLALIGVAQPAGATIDLTGNFRAEVSIPLLFQSIACSVDFVQSGTVLSATGTCDIVGTVSLPTGTIDGTTGVFSLSGGAGTICPTLALNGTASDSANFTGTASCSGGPLPFSGTMIGSRCGNGHPDPGEQCDDGNFLNGDCCSKTCQFEPSGSGCASAGNFCTSDVCNGAGICTHPNNTQACDDNNPCTENDVCGGGSCHGAFVGVGTPCDDDDPCTLGDQCDAAGACVPGSGTLDCGTCMVCVPGFGCSADGVIPTSCKVPTRPFSSPLVIADRTPDTHDKLTWELVKGSGTAVTDFGDPRAATSYKLCLFNQTFGDAYDFAIFGADIPAGGTCGGGPCWTGTNKGYKYKNKTGNTDGIQEVVLVAGPSGRTKIVIKGKGVGLHPPTLPIDLRRPVLMQLQADNGQCWQAEYVSALKNTPIGFRAKGSSPSGAFVGD